MQITKKQAAALFIICLIGTKFQRLPSFLASNAGRDLWIIILLYLLVDGLFLCFTLKIVEFSKGLTLEEFLKKMIGNFGAKIVLFLIGTYYLICTILPYEAIQEVFTEVIFDRMPWYAFAIFMLITMGALACSGLKTIGRMCQLYFLIIIVGVFGLLFLGLSKTDFSGVMPIVKTNVVGLFEGFYRSCVWFGDYLILLVLMGHIQNFKKQDNFGFMKLCFYGGMLVVSFAYVVFYGIFKEMTPQKTNLLTNISQFSLLALDIGRLDYFLIIFAEIATILTAGIFLFASATCFMQSFGVKKPNVIIYSLLVIIYILTSFVIRNKILLINMIMKLGLFVCPVVQYALPIFILVVAALKNKKSNKQFDKLRRGQKNEIG